MRLKQVGGTSAWGGAVRVTFWGAAVAVLIDGKERSKIKSPAS